MTTLSFDSPIAVKLKNSQQRRQQLANGALSVLIALALGITYYLFVDKLFPNGVFEFFLEKFLDLLEWLLPPGARF